MTQDLSCHAHRRVIGALGLALPVLLYVSAGVFHVDGVEPWHLLRSISSYYHTGAVGVFVGILFALSLSLFTYRGYKEVAADRILGFFGGASAAALAFFPGDPPKGTVPPDWSRPWMNDVHVGSAVVLFGVFLLFSLWLFRKSDSEHRRNRSPQKRCRDNIYLACGIVIGLCVVLVAVFMRLDWPIVLPEFGAIGAFSVSWLVKGDFFEWCRDRPPSGA